MGLQVDGDLREQAWIAVKKRGTGNQSLRKVKGRATETDVEKRSRQTKTGRATTRATSWRTKG